MPNAACVRLPPREKSVRNGFAAGGTWILTIGPATEKLPSGAAIGFRARLHQLGEALIRRGTKSSNPASSSGESQQQTVPALGFDRAADSSSRMPFSIRMWETASGGCYRGVL